MDEAWRVLIVEDDPDIASVLSRGIERAGFTPCLAADAATAERLAGGGIDAAIIDVILGDDDGRDLVRHLRAKGMRAPIILLSALSEVDDRARGLDAGADDYIAKPFEIAEVVTRLKVQVEVRRAQRVAAGWRYDATRREVICADISIALTEREGALLAFLMARAGEVISRGEIFDALWLQDGGHSENVVDVYIGYIRRKLSPLAGLGVTIRTIRSRGFLFKAE